MVSAQPIRCELCNEKASRRSASARRRRLADQNGSTFICLACRDRELAPDQYRCLGINARGNRCEHWVIDFPTQYCWVHGGKKNDK